LAGLEIAADDAEHDLRRQLLADGHFAVFGEPETHKRKGKGERRKGKG
jgi:hypothetical protein